MVLVPRTGPARPPCPQPRYLLDHLAALAAVHAQQGPPVLDVRVQQLQDLLRRQLLPDALVLAWAETRTESRHPCPQGTVSRQHTPHSPAHRRHRGQDAPQAAALEAPCLQLQTQTMHPAGQAGAGGECCAADVSRRREERSGCRAGWRGAGPLPWVGLFPPCPLLRAGPQQALVSVGNGPVCTISRSLLEHDLLPYPVLGCV